MNHRRGRLRADSSFFTDFRTNASARPLHFGGRWTTLRAPHRLVKNAWNTPSKPRRSIVIVDDEKSYAELMGQMIADNLDCAVHVFTRPMEAMARLAQISAGVVVTDYSMPQMNGVEFIKQASKIAPDATFVLISGEDLDALEHELARLRRLKLRLRKPFGWRPLAEAVIKVWPGPDHPLYRPNGPEPDRADEVRAGAISHLP
jgi:CheY-like chemotaxis protein